MGLKGFTRLASIMMIFFFLPSIGIKIWEYLSSSSWAVKSWLIYLMIGLIIIYFVRRRWKKRLLYRQNTLDDASFLRIAKERLAKGEINITEFREIKQELTGISANRSAIRHTKSKLADIGPVPKAETGYKIEQPEV